MSCARRSPESRTPALRALRAGSLCPFRVVCRAPHVLHVSLFSSSRRAPGAHGLRPGGAPPWRRSRRAPPSDPSPRLTGVAADDKLGTIPVLVVCGSAPLPGPWEDSPGMRETGSASAVSGSNAMHADERSQATCRGENEHAAQPRLGPVRSGHRNGQPAASVASHHDRRRRIVIVGSFVRSRLPFHYSSRRSLVGGPVRPPGGRSLSEERRPDATRTGTRKPDISARASDPAWCDPTGGGTRAAGRTWAVGDGPIPNPSRDPRHAWRARRPGPSTRASTWGLAAAEPGPRAARARAEWGCTERGASTPAARPARYAAPETAAGAVPDRISSACAAAYRAWPLNPGLPTRESFARSGLRLSVLSLGE